MARADIRCNEANFCLKCQYLGVVLTAILITSVWGPSMVNAMVAIGIFYIPIFARLTRAVAMSVWEREYITAARAAGLGEGLIAWRHVLPNILSPLLIQGTIQFAVAILAEAGLSYLGLEGN